MVGIGITARFPLGVYHGHQMDGSPESFPTPVRLFSALVNAAHTASLGDDGHVKDDDARALEWLESHPPSGLLLPDAMAVYLGQGRRIAYRQLGLREKEAAKSPVAKVVSDGTAVNGSIGWSWDSIPEDVQLSLSRLCADIPCLGEMDSPAVLEVGEVQANWCLDDQAGRFTPGARTVPVPAPGRWQALRDLHARAHPRKRPTAASDKVIKTEEEMLQPVSVAGVKRCVYVQADAAAPPVMRTPWHDVLILEVLGRTPSVTARTSVDWCVALHRAVVSRIGDGAPAVVTGHYPSDAPVPANRMVIQYLPPALLAQSTVHVTGDGGAFAILVPADVAEQDMVEILRALAGMTELRSRWGRLALKPSDELVYASTFWQPPVPGTGRIWATYPAAVPEVVRQRGDWTLTDAILLSLGFVWRDRYEVEGRGARAYRSLVRQVRDDGAEVLTYRRLVSDQGAYAHHMPKDMVSQPYRALISLGSLAHDTELVAIGQSRHLGGGLLTPVDVPEGELMTHTESEGR